MNTAKTAIFETEAFFRLSSDLHQAEASASPALVADALDELVVFWGRTTNAKVRNRCAELLESRGQGAAMDLICEQMAS